MNCLAYFIKSTTKFHCCQSKYNNNFNATEQSLQSFNLYKGLRAYFRHRVEHIFNETEFDYAKTQQKVIMFKLVYQA